MKYFYLNLVKNLLLFTCVCLILTSSRIGEHKSMIEMFEVNITDEKFYHTHLHDFLFSARHPKDFHKTFYE